MTPDLIDAGAQLVEMTTSVLKHGDVKAVVTGTSLGPGFFNLNNMLTPQNVALIVVSWALTELLSRSSRGWRFVREHLLPLMPVIFCEGFVFATASWQPEATWGERALLGALLGTVTVWGHMAAQRTGMLKYLPFLKAPEAADAPTPLEPASVVVAVPVAPRSDAPLKY